MSTALAQKPKRMNKDEIDPFADGWEANERGQSPIDNPYELGEPEYAMWLDGWIKRNKS